MFKRLIFLLCLAGNAFAQSQPIALSADSSIRSIIVKFRTAGEMGDPNLIAKLQAVSATSDVLQPVFKRPPAKGAKAQSISVPDNIGIERIFRIKLRDGISAADAVKSLSGVSAFEYVEPNYRYHIQTGKHIPNDPLYSAEWWLASIHAPEAWKITEGDSSIHIGFVDTGVDWLHPDLKFQFAVNPAEDINHNGLFDAWPSDSVGMDARGDMVHGDIDGIDHDGNGYANDVIGYDFVDEETINVGDWSGRDPFPQDEEGHGTAIAGILAAQQDNNIGISGVAPRCKLVALRAFDALGRGEDKDIASAIVYAADNNVRVLNCSFGDVVPSLLQRDAIRYAVAKGVAVFGSSGNSTYSSTDPNYPSDFDEVVSVGGSAPVGLYFSTTHGEEMDVVAPAADVYTTKVGGGYDSVSGTSAASPIAAGIAALLLSKNPSLTPIELRSIIESTTEDVGTKGYDDRSANGQLDAFAALSYPGNAAIKMVTPHSLDQFRIGDTIRITGDAVSTLFTGYTLSWSKVFQKDTISRDQFGNAVQIFYDSTTGASFVSSNSQVLDSTLGVLDTRGFDTGVYTIRFAVTSSDNRSTEEHCQIYLARAPPKFRFFSVDSIFAGKQPGVPVREGLVVLANSDIPTQLQVNYAAAGAKFSTKSDDHLSREHWVMISPEEAETNVPLTIQATLRAPDGDTAVMTDTASIANQAFPEQGFVEKPYSLPAGYALDSILSLPSGDEVVENLDAGGMLHVLTFDSTKRFRIIDSNNDGSLPRAIGNTTGDNKPELLVQSVANICHGFQFCGHTGVYKQNASHSLLGDLIYKNDTLFGSTFAKLDPNNKQEIIGSIDSVYKGYEFDGNGYSLVGSMVNASSPDTNNQLNDYSEPHAGHADLRGSGTEDLITMDNDADLVVYERDKTEPTGFRTVFIDSNAGVSNGAFVTTGDFDGDGKPDIAYGFHPNIEHDTLGEYPFAYWTIKVLRNLGGMKFETILNAHFYDGYSMYDPDPRDAHSSSISRLRNVTGHTVDDLALCLFPNFYLMEYDSNAHAMRPVWRYPLAESRNGAISWDFDKNGKREFGFFSNDSIHFFERTDIYAERTPAPAALNVSPRDTHRVDMDWSPVEAATLYYLLRVAPNDPSYTVIDSTTSTFYTDTTVADGDDWLYSVAAFDPDYPLPLSTAAFDGEAIVHAMPRLSSASLQGGNNIRVRTSQVPRSNRLYAGTIMIDDTIMPDAITMSADSALVLSLSNAINGGEHRMRVTSFGLRDINNSPFDTADYIAFNVPADTTVNRFYIVQWTFDQGPNGLRIHVIFNEQPAADALDVLHYSLSPYGTLTAVSLDSQNPNALYIEVNGVQLVALGVPFVLCVTGIESIKGIALDATIGNCAGISHVEPDLSNIMVYPNPAKQSEGGLTFARLTAQADIRIYTIKLRFIRDLTTSGSEGGVTWDMRDDAGNIVPSGEYLYYATGKNAAGLAVEGKADKLVIVNDVK